MSNTLTVNFTNNHAQAGSEEEGADSHSETAAKGIRGERIFDWLDQHIPA